jgi:hypothetical protein
VSHKAKDKSDMEALNAWIVTAKYVKMEHTIATSHNDTMAISTVSALGRLCMRATKTCKHKNTASLRAKAEEKRSSKMVHLRCTNRQDHHPEIKSG